MNRVTQWQLKTRTLPLGPLPRIMGILNVTPDSFSDGGSYTNIQATVDQALRMEDAGADILDLGGESTRPYSQTVSTDDQLARIVPVMEQLQQRISIPISIDTRDAKVADAALHLGAEIINDVSGLEGDPAMPEVAMRHGAAVCVMHMQGTPRTMQVNPRYDDVVAEIHQYLEDRLHACIQLGIQPSKVCLDPGIGFGKTHQHNLDLLVHVRRFLDLSVPILVGHSRKGFIAHVINDKTADRMAGTLGVSLAMARAGVHILRVHDVAATRYGLLLFAAAGGLDN